MVKNQVIFINDNLNLSILTEKLEEFASYSLILISYEDIKSDYIRGKIKELKASQLIVIIDSTVYNDVKEDLDKYLHNCFKIHFTHIIFISPDYEYLKDPKFIRDDKYVMYFSTEQNIDLQAIYFNLYISNLFDKFTVQERLTDYICNSFREVVYSELLAKKNREINILNSELEKKNRIDNLTKLLNRNALYDCLEKERRRTIRDKWRIENSGLAEYNTKKNKKCENFTHTPSGDLLDHFGIFAIMMLDIDYFKKVNDTYGHLKGDEVLKTLAILLQKEGILRNNDVAGRFGGEEFIIILPETNAKHAFEPATRLLEEFRNLKFKSDEGEVFQVTLSIGISEFLSDDKNNEDIIQRADKALYYAKDHGRNRIVIYEDLEDF